MDRIEFFIAILLLSFINVDGTGNALNASEVLQDDELLTSNNEIYQLGFFNTTSSNTRYLGIWYNLPIRMIVWVANRDRPIINGTGTLYLSPDGTLFIQNSTGQDIWSSGSQFSLGEPQPQACLLDSGHLVVNDTNTGKILWQSSYQLSDSQLHSTPIGYVKLLDSTIEFQVSNWSGTGIVPSSEQFVRKMDPARRVELVTFKGSDVFYRTGPWNGTGWNGFFKMFQQQSLKFHVSSSENGAYFWYELINSSEHWNLVLKSDGIVYVEYWHDANWTTLYTLPSSSDESNSYARCGPYGISTDTTCVCCSTNDFHPKNQADWRNQIFSGGCERNVPLNGTYHKFVTVGNLKLPDTINATSYGNLSKSECESRCRKNSSCMAYAHIGWQGCLAWFGELNDMQQFDPNVGAGDNLYIRVASKKGKIIFIIVAISIVAVLILLAAVLFLLRKFPIIRWPFTKHLQTENNQSNSQEDIQIFESIHFDTIRAATGDFNKANIIGEGMLGPVYEGVLENGEEIAVKRLSKNVSKGKEQLKNELYLLARLKHKNLVKLTGFCVQQQEIILCYEFMQNNSLDQRLFGTRLPEGNSELNWEQRYRIIQGISSGLLYLHEDNGDTIIHRDVKPGNVLLDRKMVPKISDFGLAKFYEEDRSFFVNTSIGGTLGYMAPELQNGMLSTKADVYSFGMVILEIISGERNTSHPIGLKRLVLQYLKEGSLIELKDARLKEPCSDEEIKRCVHIALLCLLEEPQTRPNMREINLMLTSISSPLPSLPHLSSYWGNVGPSTFVDSSVLLPHCF